MKSISIILLICFTSTAILGDTSIALAQEKSLTTIAVTDLEAQEGVSVKEARTLSDRLRAELVKTRMFDVVERSKVDNVLTELRFQLSDIFDQYKVVELGKWIGAEKMMAGSVGKVGEVYAVSLWLVDLKTGKIKDSVTEDCRCEIGELLRVIENLAKELAGVPVISKPSRRWFWLLLLAAGGSVTYYASQRAEEIQPATRGTIVIDMPWPE